MTRQLSLVFFGSGPVAARSLAALDATFSVELVVTKPTPPHHKDAAPVETFAQEKGLPITYVQNAGQVAKVFTGKPAASRVGVVVDFGVILPQTVIDYFEFGIINSHFSLLPQWRGADPITFSILSGQEKTGVSLMRITAGLDEGDLLVQRSLEISPRSLTNSELTDALIELSNALLIDTLPLYLKGDITPYPQPTEGITYSRKLTKQDGILDWNKPATVLEREVRAYEGWPKSRAMLGGIEVIVTKASVRAGNGIAGTLLIENKTIGVQCAEGILQIDELRPSGKPTMSAEAFIAGYGNKLRLS